MPSRIYTDQITLRDVDFYKGTVDPNGVVQAKAGSMYIDDSGAIPVVWRNLDDSTLWVSVTLPMPMTLVYQPGGGQAENVYSSWSDLMQVHDFFAALPKEIAFSDLFQIPEIPVGPSPYDFRSTTLKGLLRTAIGDRKVTVQIADGAQILMVRLLENLKLVRQAGASGVPIIDIASAGIKRMSLRNVTLKTLAGASAPFIRLSNAASVLYLQQGDGDLDSEDSNAPVVDLSVAGADVLWEPIRSNTKTADAIRSVVGTNTWTFFKDGDSKKLKQSGILGSELVYGAFADAGFRVTYQPSATVTSGFVFDRIGSQRALRMLLTCSGSFLQRTGKSLSLTILS